MKNRIFRHLAVISAAIGSGSVFAALPSGVSGAVSAIQTDGLAMADLIWPVIIALVGSVVLMKLFKRFVNKI